MGNQWNGIENLKRMSVWVWFVTICALCMRLCLLGEEGCSSLLCASLIYIPRYAYEA